MNRLSSRVGVRALSVVLLSAGLAGGVYLGRDREARQADAEASNAVQVDVDDMQLLKRRQSEHAAARAWQRQAEGDAAARAAVEARTAAGRAHKLEEKAIAQKKAKNDRKKAGGPVPFAGKIPSSCNEYSGSRAIGCTLMLNAGFTIDQFPCLDRLWKKESGWNYRAANRGSGAYGIPQALPGKKMSSAGADWETNPATQIKWGLGYIKGKYHSPCGAWSHSESVGSY